MLERLVGADRPQRLAHPLAQPLGQPVDGVENPGRVSRRLTERHEHVPRLGGHEPCRQDEARPRGTDVAGDHCLESFPHRDLAREREIERRLGRALHPHERLAHVLWLGQVDQRRLREIDAECLRHHAAEQRIAAVARNVGNDDPFPRVDDAGSDERAHGPDPERAHHHVARHRNPQTRKRQDSPHHRLVPGQPMPHGVEDLSCRSVSCLHQPGRDHDRESDQQQDRRAREEPVWEPEREHRAVDERQDGRRGGKVES